MIEAIERHMADTTVQAVLCDCSQCGHLWLVPVERGEPVRCSRCKSSRWNVVAGARVRATPRAAVLEASPISRRNQSRTDHTATKSNRTPWWCPLPEMRNALREHIRVARARLLPMIVGATDHAASPLAKASMLIYFYISV